jgi:uncharacterized protein YbcI
VSETAAWKDATAGLARISDRGGGAGPLVTDRKDPLSVPAHSGALLTTISNALVRLHKEYYGKGPTKAKTYAVNDTVVCVLKGGFTTVERTLIDDGKAEDVETIRRSFQRTMKQQFTGVVAQATGRSVIAYMSQVHSNPDLAVELFVLEPKANLRGAHEEDYVEEEESAA